MKTVERQNRRKTLQELQAFKSANTGLIHLNRAKKPYVKDDLIPISYNFLYQLLLFRTKERTNIEEAFKELNHLLTFQIKEGPHRGNFPVYLHEYPECQRAFEILFSLFPLYWIAKDFTQLLEPNLRKKLYDALEMGIEFTENMARDKEFSYLLSMQIAALSFAIGSLMEKTEWIEKGSLMLERLAKRGAQECWGAPRNLSKMLASLHLISDPEQLKQWDFFFSYLNKTWVKDTLTYAGPSLSEHYEGVREENTLYHLFMERQTSDDLRLNYSPITQLEEELLIGGEINLDELAPSTSVFLGPFQWDNIKSKTYCCSFFNLFEGSWVKTGGYYPLKVALKKDKGLDDFILQMGSRTTVKVLDQNKILLTFEKEPEEELDVAFFWNLSSKAKFLIDGVKASMFQLHQSVEIQYESHTIAFKFLDPNQKVWGQLMRKNRRTQLLEQEAHFFDAHLYFREVEELTGPFQIELEIREN